MNFLFFSPVGCSARNLLPDTVSRMIEAGGNILLGIYDDWKVPAPILDCHGVTISYEPGKRKWQMAKKLLRPDLVAQYDYIFLWDDDMDIFDFDPSNFLHIMRKNELEVAQPSIVSPHDIVHSITQQRPYGTIFPSGQVSVGRFTNFVEIMVPVFSVEGWRRMYSYLDDENEEAFGYDSIPFGRRGIVDSMCVIHTRENRDKNSDAYQRMNNFFDNHGLYGYTHVNMGHLFQ